jgi:hypothetical protein
MSNTFLKSFLIIAAIGLGITICCCGTGIIGIQSSVSGFKKEVEEMVNNPIPSGSYVMLIVDTESTSYYKRKAMIFTSKFNVFILKKGDRFPDEEIKEKVITDTIANDVDLERYGGTFKQTGPEKLTLNGNDYTFYKLEVENAPGSSSDVYGAFFTSNNNGAYFIIYLSDQNDYNKDAAIDYISKLIPASQ